MTDNAAHERGQTWAYTGAIVGGLVSIAANVAHSFVAPPGAPTGWRPEPGAVISSIFWPILLFIAVEILFRVKWFPGFWWGVLRFGGMIPVAAIAGIVSWQHLSALLLHYGEDPLIAFLGPLAVDGLMFMATIALLVIVIRKDQHQDTQAGHSEHPPATTDSDNASAAAAKQLLSTARFAITNHQSRYGEPMTADQLAQVMNIPEPVARRLLTDLTPATVANGQLTGGAIA